ncbi:MAG: hypothetical protein ACXAAT_19955, partial [Candidatus Hodarchaeales archaeon]
NENCQAIRLIRQIYSTQFSQWTDFQQTMFVIYLQYNTSLSNSHTSTILIQDAIKEFSTSLASPRNYLKGFHSRAICYF